jgi:DNA-binding PucR family transcriptional regulator
MEMTDIQKVNEELEKLLSQVERITGKRDLSYASLLLQMRLLMELHELREALNAIAGSMLSLASEGEDIYEYS